MKTREEQAATMRDAFLGPDLSVAVPWGDLKQCVRDRWLAALDALRERVSVPGVDPPAGQVEALARVLRAAPDKWWPALDETWDRVKDMYLDQARAAIAHLSKRPEGLPTAEELAEIVHEVIMNPSLKSPVSPHIVEAILAALGPWLRDPVGTTLDVTAGEIMHACTTNMNGYEVVIDLCRSRIRPTYECKECAKERKRGDKWADDAVKMAGMINAARAALEGE